LIDALGDLILPKAVPSFVVLEDSKSPLESLLRLAPPMFICGAADGDEFYGRFYEEMAADEIVWDGGKEATRYSTPGDEDAEAGEGESFPMTDDTLARVNHWQTEGEVVLCDLEWLEQLPKSVAMFRKVMRAADEAFHGEIDAYDVDNHRPKQGEPRKKKGTPGQTLPDQLEGVGGVWLGSTRTSCVHQSGPRSRPRVLWGAKGGETSGTEWGGDPVVGDGIVVGAASHYNASIGALRLDGKPLWKCTLASSQSHPAGSAAIDRGTVYQGTNHGLYALDAGTGKERWCCKINGINGSAPMVVNDLVFIASKGALNAVDIATGRKKWQFKYKGENYEENTPVLHYDGVLFWRGNKWLFALPIDNKGKDLLWKREVGSHRVAGPALVDGKLWTMVNVGYKPGLECINPGTGKSEWRLEIDSVGHGNFAANGAQLVLRDDDGKVR
jgi:hypothetical protein